MDVGCAKGAHADDGGRVIDVLPRAAGDVCVAAETVPGLCATLAELLPARGDESAVLVAFDDGKDVQRAIETAKAAVETGARAVLVAASDEAAAAAVAAARLPYARAAYPGTPCARPQFALASAILALGADVLLVGHGATMHGPNPLVNLPPRRGADAEGVPAAEEMIRQLAEGQETVVRTAREVFPAADAANDESTADLLTQRMQLHEKNAWMLRSMLA